MDSLKIEFSILFFIWASLTCLSSSLSSEYSIIGHELDRFPSEEGVVELFELWKQKHSKVYKHSEEAERRFQNFKKNLKYVLEKNAQRSSSIAHRVGLNRFADMSNEEFKNVYLSSVKKPINKMRNSNLKRNMRGRIQSCDAPSALDWRKKGVVTAVKNQASCGKLNYFTLSMTKAIEFYCFVSSNS